MAQTVLAVVHGADDQGLIEQAGAGGGFIPRVEDGQQLPDLRIHLFHQVGVEIQVLALDRGRRQRPQPRRQCGEQLPMRAGLLVDLQILPDRRWQGNGRVGRSHPTGIVVAAGLIGLGVADHVMRIHQRQDEAEGLGRGMVPAVPQEGHRVIHKPGVMGGGSAAKILLRRVPSGIGRIPAVKTVARDIVFNGFHIGSDGVFAHVPLPLVHDVVAGLFQTRGEVGQGGIELRFNR